MRNFSDFLTKINGKTALSRLKKYKNLSLFLGCFLVANLGFAGADLPAEETNSLFDLWLAERGNQIPYPFSSLVRQLSDTHEVDVTVIPFGRSLQKKSTDLLNPRLVLAVTASKPHNPSSLSLSNKLYIGYSKTAAALEIISYNERQSRFEFQVVKNYSNNQKPELYYANRSQCVSCHQNEAPRFSVFPWTDTHEDQTTLVALRKLHPTGQYEGIDINTHAGQSQAAAIDFAIHERASALVNLQLLWQQGCGFGPDKHECKRTLLKALFKFREDGVLSNQHSKEALMQITNHCSAPILSFATSELSNANVVSLVESNFLNIVADDSFSPSQATAIAHEVHAYMLPAKLNPLRAMTTVNISCQLFPRQTHSNYVLSVIKDGAEALLPEEAWHQFEVAYQSASDGQLVHQTLGQHLANNVEFMNAVIAHGPLSFESILVNLHKHTAWNSLPAHYDSLYQQALPPRLYTFEDDPSDPANETLPPEKQEVLNLFKTYCATCHASAEENQLNFMHAKNDVERWQKIIKHPNIVKRLSWETLEDESSAMPPSYSRQGRALRSPAHAEDRMKMLDGILSN